VFATGQTFRTGGITKQGRQELRTVMVEAAWGAVAKPGHWQAVFECLAVRMGRSKAIVAIARKLLVVVWNVLSKQPADAVRVAGKLLTWAYEIGKIGRRGLGGTAFVRQQLVFLKLGESLTEIKWAGKNLALPPPTAQVGAAK